MSHVFLVIQYVQYEGSDVLAVLGDLKEANSYAKYLANERNRIYEYGEASRSGKYPDGTEKWSSDDVDFRVDKWEIGTKKEYP